MVRLRDRPCSTQKDVANSRKELACEEYFVLAARWSCAWSLRRLHVRNRIPRANTSGKSSTTSRR